MEKIHPVFVAELNKKYADRFTIESERNSTFICFPEKTPEFGSLEIHEQYPGEYILYVGKFTHCHFDHYEGDEKAQVKEAVEKIIYFLEKIFTDNVICYGSHAGGGGCYVKDHEHDDFFSKKYDSHFVWSGTYKKPSNLSDK